MNIIHGYVTRLLAARFLFIFCTLVVFVLSVDLMINSQEVVESRDGDMMATLNYAFLRLPEIASLLLAPATLLAAIATFAGLIRHNELVAIWNSRVSPLRTCIAITPFAVLLGLAQFFLDGEGVPRTLQRLNDWGVGDYGHSLSNRTTDGAFWLRSGNDIVRLPSVTFDLTKLESLTIFQRDYYGRLIARLDAGGVRQENDQWYLTDVVRRGVNGARVETFDRLPWITFLPLDDLRTMAADPSELTIWRLFRFVTDQSFGIFPPHSYEVWMHRILAASLSPMLLIFFIILLAQRVDRGGAVAGLLVKGLAFGFAYFILVKMSLALGEANLLPPIIAAWIPPVILASVAGGFGFHHETTYVPGSSASPPSHENGPEQQVLGVVSSGTGASGRDG